MAALPPGPRPSWEPDPPAPGAGAGAGTDALTVNALYPDGEPDWSSPQLDAAVLPEGLTRFRARRSTAPVLVVLGLVALVGSVVLLTTRGALLGHVLRALGGALVPVAVTVGYLLWAARTARYRILVLVAFLWGTTELLAEYGLEDVVGQVRLSFLLPQVAVSPGLGAPRWSTPCSPGRGWPCSCSCGARTSAASWTRSPTRASWPAGRPWSSASPCWRGGCPGSLPSW